MLENEDDPSYIRTYQGLGTNLQESKDIILANI